MCISRAAEKPLSLVRGGAKGALSLSVDIQSPALRELTAGGSGIRAGEVIIVVAVGRDGE